jgi:cytochrome P450
MFGSDVENKMDEIAEVLKTMQEFSSEATKTLFKIPLGIPTRKNIAFKQAEARFEKIIYEIINQRKSASNKNDADRRNDLLQLLVSAYDDESKTFMTERQLRDEITTIFMAGHETTSQTLGWVFYHLALSPEFYNAIKKEKAACREIKSFDGLQHLSYTKSFIEETLWFYPPVWIIARKCFAPDIITGYKLPAASTVLINVYGLHHGERHWNDAGHFNPLNFSKEGKESMVPFSYLPFGGGQRLCIGHHFAMMVMQTVVAKLVEHFEFKIAPGFVPEVDPNLTLRAKDGIKLLVKSTN